MKRTAYSVGQVNAYIKNMFAQDFLLHNICVKGEVSNCKYHTSGHIYFTIKDEKAAMSAIMFSGSRSGLDSVATVSMNGTALIRFMQGKSKRTGKAAFF